ncbi:hypothetical protein GCM10028799_37410 [Kribbella italica]
MIVSVNTLTGRADTADGVVSRAEADQVVAGLLADEQTGVASPRVEAAAAKPGWRWDTYTDVQLQVPDDWAQRLWAGPPDCTEDDWVPEPTVFRPGGARPASLKVCLKPKPARQVAPSVVFGGERPGVVPLAGGWVRETRKVGKLLVTVTAGDAVLRRQILDSAGVVDTVDSYGCAPRADRQVGRPPANGGLKSVGDIVGVSICRYSIQGMPISPTGSADDLRFARLQAGSRLTGGVADHLVRDLIAAPPGAGPTFSDPRTCGPATGPDRGTEFLILRVQGSAHAQDVLYRYDGCRTNGTDDGSALRQLTADTARQIFLGVHQLRQYVPALDKLLIGTPPPVR